MKKLFPELQFKFCTAWVLQDQTSFPLMTSDLQGERHPDSEVHTKNNHLQTPPLVHSIWTHKVCSEKPERCSRRASAEGAGLQIPKGNLHDSPKPQLISSNTDWLLNHDVITHRNNNQRRKRLLRKRQHKYPPPPMHKPFGC